MRLNHGPDALILTEAEDEVDCLMGTMGALDGTVVGFASGKNGPGVGYIKSSGDGTTLAWKAPGSSTFGTPVTASNAVQIMLGDGDDADSFIKLTGYTAYLQGGGNQQAVRISELWGEDYFPMVDVTAEQASSGATLTLDCELSNESSANVHRVTAWIDSSCNHLSISDGVGGYSSPTTEGTGIDLGDVAVGGTTSLNIRRTIPASTASSVLERVLIHLSFVSFG